MTRLLTLAEVKRNLAYDTTDDDTRLTELIEDVSGAIMNYLEASWARVRQFSGDDDVSDEEIAAYQKAFGAWTDSGGNVLTDSTGDPATDSTGASVVPRSVRRAAHLMIGALDKDREGQTDGFTPAVVSLLVRYRNPTVA